ncbi:MAG: YjdF family protein [Bacillota bacterium]|nr:YjdF family protein [Bacillota bacterium]
MNIKLTVFFDDPFWVGVFERTDEGMLETSRVVFGSEPKDYEVYSFVLQNYSRLCFSCPVKVDGSEERKINPKRIQRLAYRETQETGVGTKAQLAMKLEHEARKLENKKHSKERKEETERIKFEKKQSKKKEKQKGH